MFPEPTRAFAICSGSAGAGLASAVVEGHSFDEGAPYVAVDGRGTCSMTRAYLPKCYGDWSLRTAISS